MSKNTALKKLNCSFNQLTKLDVSNNTALTDLYCDANSLTRLDVTKNTNLKTLYCTGNNMASPDSVIGWRELGLVINSPESPNSGTFRFYPQYSMLYGDVNGDGAINFYDAVLVIMYVNGWHVDIDIPAADVSGDGEVTFYDAVLIVRYFNGLIDKFPVEI